MLQPTNESAGLASGPHPLTQRINEDQAIIEFPGEKKSWEIQVLMICAEAVKARLRPVVHNADALSPAPSRVLVLRLAAEDEYSPS